MGRLKIRDDGEWKYVGYGQMGPTGPTGPTGSEGSTPDGTVSISARSMEPGLSHPCEDLITDESSGTDTKIIGLPFEPGQAGDAEISFIMPTDWDGGTITAKFFWTVLSGESNSGTSVVWMLSGRSFGNDEDLHTNVGSSQSVTDDWIANEDLHITSSTNAVTLAGTPAAGERVTLKVSRQGSGDDDLPVQAILLDTLISFSRS